MKNLFAIILLLCSVLGLRAQTSEKLFVYPVAPDTMMALQPRCDFIVSRFWDRCNFGTAFDKYPTQLNAAFGDWISIMPHASADTVHIAVDKLLARFSKKGAETLALATMAENWLYSDTAQYFSTELFLPFAKAAAGHKKISKAEKARFEAIVKVLESSSIGSTVPDIPVVYADGHKGVITDINAPSTLLFFNDPDCMDCRMARIRLSADHNAIKLIDKGELAIVSIYPGDPDDEGWQQAKDAADSRWVTVAMPEAYDYFDLRSTPLLLYTNRNHEVLTGPLTTDYLLAAFREAVRRQESIKEQRRQAAEKAAAAAAEKQSTQE